MKICTKCSLAKSESEYFIKDKKTGRLHAQCKDCYKEHRKSYYALHYNQYGDAYRERARVRRALIQKKLRTSMLAYLKDKTCVVCGETDVRTFEFDHIDPALKSFNIARAIGDGLSWERIMDEIKKCRLLCANCHKKHTASQYGWYKAFTE